MRRSGILICALAVISLCGAAVAQDVSVQSTDQAQEPAPVVAPAPQPEAVSPREQQLEQNLAQTQAQLDAAQRRIDELSAKFDQMRGQMEGVSQQVTAAQQGVLTFSEQLKQIENRATTPPPPAPSAFQFTPYGYIKLDIIRDQSATSGTDATAFVLSGTPENADDTHFSMTVRQSRLGLKIAGPPMEDALSSGIVEVDFYSPAVAENKPELQLRRAFWLYTAHPTAAHSWNILAGQEWEVVSPLFPYTLNYTYLALSGNPGYRKPMLRYERKDMFATDNALMTDIAITRGVVGKASTFTSLDDEGSDAAWPVAQARVGVVVPTECRLTPDTPCRPIVAGISGAYGEFQYDAFAGGHGKDIKTYMGNFDWSVPLANKLDWNGEIYAGSNLVNFMAGIAQGVNTTTEEGVRDRGGWTQLLYRPVPMWLLSVGAGIDDPDNDDIADGGRSFNATYFANAMYNINKSVMVGMEVSWMETDYVGDPDGDNLRVQSSVQYSF